MSASRFEQQQAAGYDQRIHYLIPGYELLHLISAAQLAERLPAEARLLVVGAGSGREILQLAGHHPGWRFFGNDLSADMLAIAQARCEQAGCAERVMLRAGELSTMEDQPPADAALCLLVLHFLPDDGAKLALLREIARRLQPGAPLLLADLHAPAYAEERAIHLAAGLRLGMPPERRGEVAARMERDFAAIAPQRLHALLEEAGFGAPQRYFQALGVQAFCCLKL